MDQIPVISGRNLVKFFEKIGYRVVSQKGSHIKLKLLKENLYHTIIIPNHDTVAKGTLNDILNKVSHVLNISKIELIEMIKK
jgi:predicted RNA binding protein YcfA (HicA-like mRNA interferase family)